MNHNFSESEISYNLPVEKIAEFPLDKRDESKLLVSSNSSALIESKFYNLDSFLPEQTLLIANNTRVITARIPMLKETGGAAEVLLLSPISPSPDPMITLGHHGAVRWECLIGGKKIIAGDVLLRTIELLGRVIYIKAEIVERAGTDGIVDIFWSEPEFSFAEILELIGKIPLPPYIKREVEASDEERYQTVYADTQGSVAAPTAGLHFTQEVFAKLDKKEIHREFVTLHVGAGTFRPIHDSIENHVMHKERIYIPLVVIEKILWQLESTGFEARKLPIVAVGTTSMRTLESLFIWGVKLLRNQGLFDQSREIFIEQWDGMKQQELKPVISPVESIQKVKEWCEFHQLQEISGETQLFIIPGYSFGLCDAIITNFHQPGSTLMQLIAAFVGVPRVKEIYEYALLNDFRFLSYGDSSLLWRK